MKPRRTPTNPAFRSRAFCASVVECVYPKSLTSRLHRSMVRHGRRVGYEQVGRDPWQREGGLWPASEDELRDLQTLRDEQVGSEPPF
jgi:hypothetical protein